jgi:hypothetical protein
MVEHASSTFEVELRELEFGPLHRFSAWSNDTVPRCVAGVYTIWQSQTLVYVGMSGREGLSHSLLKKTKGRCQVGKLGD